MSLKRDLYNLERLFSKMSTEAFRKSTGIAYKKAGTSWDQGGTGDEGWCEVFRNDGRHEAYFQARALIHKLRKKPPEAKATKPRGVKTFRGN